MTYTEADRRKDIEGIRTGVKAMLAPKIRAYDDFAEQVSKAAGVSIEIANKITGFYLKIKAVKWDGMRYVVKHGGFWDKEVLLRAAKEVGA